VDLDHVAHLHIRWYARESLGFAIPFCVQGQAVRSGGDATLEVVMGLFDFDQYHHANRNTGRDADGSPDNFSLAGADRGWGRR